MYGVQQTAQKIQLLSKLPAAPIEPARNGLPTVRSTFHSAWLLVYN